MQKLENSLDFQPMQFSQLETFVQVICVKPAIVVLQDDIHFFFLLLSTRKGDFVSAVCAGERFSNRILLVHR